MYKSILILGLITLLVACKEDDVSSKLDIIIDENQFENAPRDPFIWKEVKLDGDCLQLTIEYGGGCGEVEAKLIDSGILAESLPPIRSIRLSFKDDDLCEALVEKTYEFDMTPTRVDESKSVRIIVDGLSEELLYQY